MLNKKEFIRNRPFDEIDAMDMQNKIEQSMKDLAKSLTGFGVIEGLKVSNQGAMVINIEKGSGYDNEGNRLVLQNNELIQLNFAPQDMIAIITIKKALISKDNVDITNKYDLGNDLVYSRDLLVSYELKVHYGTPGVTPIRPKFPSDELELAEILIKSGSPDINIKDTRKFVRINNPYYLNVKSFDAKGDGVTNDTLAIQNVIDFLNKNGGGSIVIPKGTYVISSLTLYPNISLLGHEAVFFRPKNTPNWTRMIQCTNYESDVDSAPLVIKGITLDGNIYNQGPYLNWEQEQSSLMLLGGRGNKAGKLTVIIENCHLKNSVSDGIHLWTNVKAMIANCTAIDCFRGGLTITGGHADITVNNFIVRDTQKLFTTGIDVEIDSRGFNNSLSINITINGMIVESDFDMDVGVNSTADISNVIMDKNGVGGYWFSGRDSTIMVSNSVFVHSYEFTRLSGNENYKNYSGGVNLHDVKFSNCKFYVKNSTSRQSEIACFGMNYYQSPGPADVKFVDCDFKSLTHLSNFDKAIGFHLDAGINFNSNKLLTFTNCNISDDFDNAFETFLGGRINIENCEFNAKSTSLFMRGGSYDYGDYRYYLYINGFKTNAPNYARITGNDANVVEQYNVILNESGNKIISDYGMNGIVFLGSRTIYGENNPITKPTPGFIGDKYINRNPKKGQVLEWICIESDEDNAVWEQVSTVGKYYSNTPNIGGDWKVGDIIWNSDIASNPVIGWVCVNEGEIAGGAPWQSGVYYYTGALISDGDYVYRANNYGHTPYNESAPAFPTIRGGKILNTPNVQRWKPNTQYSMHDIVLPPIDNGKFFYCWNDGISGATPPNWDLEELGETYEGTLEWGTRTIIEFENIGSDTTKFESFGIVGATANSIVADANKYTNSEIVKAKSYTNTEIQNAADTLNTEITRNKNYIDAEISEVNGSITSINSEIVEINNDIASNSSAISGINSDITSINSDVASIDSKIVSIDSEISDIMDDITNLNSKNSFDDGIIIGNYKISVNQQNGNLEITVIP